MFSLFAGEEGARWLLECEHAQDAHEVAQSVSARLKSTIVVAFGSKEAMGKRCCVFRAGVRDGTCESGWSSK